jgi:hypothetical protein
MRAKRRRSESVAWLTPKNRAAFAYGLGDEEIAGIVARPVLPFRTSAIPGRAQFTASLPRLKALTAPSVKLARLGQGGVVSPEVTTKLPANIRMQQSFH